MISDLLQVQQELYQFIVKIGVKPISIYFLEYTLKIVATQKNTRKTSETLNYFLPYIMSFFEYYAPFFQNMVFKEIRYNCDISSSLYTFDGHLS